MSKPLKNTMAAAMAKAIGAKVVRPPISPVPQQSRPKDVADVIAAAASL